MSCFFLFFSFSELGTFVVQYFQLVKCVFLQELRFIVEHGAGSLQRFIKWNLITALASLWAKSNVIGVFITARAELKSMNPHLSVQAEDTSYTWLSVFLLPSSFLMSSCLYFFLSLSPFVLLFFCLPFFFFPMSPSFHLLFFSPLPLSSLFIFSLFLPYSLSLSFFKSSCLSLVFILSPSLVLLLVHSPLFLPFSFLSASPFFSIHSSGSRESR